MDVLEARSQVLEAIHPDNFYYSHVLPPAYTNWIDGLAWGSLARGAALLKRDWEVASLFFEYTQRLMSVGKDARNYAPHPVQEGWLPSSTMPGFWYRQKPQSFAGPASLKWANRCANLARRPQVEDPFEIDRAARWMVATGWLWGQLCWWFKYPRQHLNSVWLAHLYLGRRPHRGLLWTTQENPFFSYIGGIPCRVNPPETYRTVGGYEVVRKKVVPLSRCEPSAWIFRRDPFVEYVRIGEPAQRYTPIWWLVSEYLQSLLPTSPGTNPGNSSAGGS